MTHHQSPKSDSEDHHETAVHQNKRIAEEKQLLQIKRQVEIGSEIKHKVRKHHDDNDQSEFSAGFRLFID